MAKAGPVAEDFAEVAEGTVIVVDEIGIAAVETVIEAGGVATVPIEDSKMDLRAPLEIKMMASTLKHRKWRQELCPIPMEESQQYHWTLLKTFWQTSQKKSEEP